MTQRGIFFKNTVTTIVLHVCNLIVSVELALELHVEIFWLSIWETVAKHGNIRIVKICLQSCLWRINLERTNPWRASVKLSPTIL
jgi:hypothetical protein